MKLRIAAATIALAMMIGVATGCVPEPAASPSPSGFASEDEAFAAAEATYRAYVDALNQVDLSDPETFEAVYAWTTGEFNAGERKSLSEMHAKGWIVSGRSAIDRLERLSVSSDFGQISLGSCANVSDVQLVDSAGASQVDSDRPAVQSTTVSLVAGDSSTRLVIADIAGSDLEPPCDS